MKSVEKERPYPSANMKLIFLLFVIVSLCAVGIVIGGVSLIDTLNNNDSNTFTNQSFPVDFNDTLDFSSLTEGFENLSDNLNFG
jgi:hypothetical protein